VTSTNTTRRSFVCPGRLLRHSPCEYVDEPYISWK